MHKALFSVFKFILLFLIAFALLALSFKGINVKQVIDETLKANLWWIALSSVVGIVSMIIRAYRWKLLIQPLGYSPSLKYTTYSLMLGYFANLAFPRLGEITRCGSLSKAEKIPFTMLLGTVVTERVIDVICLSLCLIFTALVEFHRLGNFLQTTILTPLVEKIKNSITFPLLLAIAGLVIVIILFSWYFIKKFYKKHYQSKAIQILEGLTNGLLSIGKLKKPGQFIFHTILIWILYFICTDLSLFALQSTSNLGPGAALFILVAGGLGMSAPVQGGIGSYHLFVSQGLMLYGLSRLDGITIATLLHASQTIITILLGLISLLFLFMKKRSSDK